MEDTVGWHKTAEKPTAEADEGAEQYRVASDPGSFLLCLLQNQ